MSSITSSLINSFYNFIHKDQFKNELCYVDNKLAVIFLDIVAFKHKEYKPVVVQTVTGPRYITRKNVEKYITHQVKVFCESRDVEYSKAEVKQSISIAFAGKAFIKPQDIIHVYKQEAERQSKGHVRNQYNNYHETAIVRPNRFFLEDVLKAWTSESKRTSEEVWDLLETHIQYEECNVLRDISNKFVNHIQKHFFTPTHAYIHDRTGEIVFERPHTNGWIEVNIQITQQGSSVEFPKIGLAQEIFARPLKVLGKIFEASLQEGKTLKQAANEAADKLDWVEAALSEKMSAY